MNIFQKLFGKIQSIGQSDKLAREKHIQTVTENTDKLWLYLQETLDYYNSISCPCAFPRYRQLVGINCVDYGKNFYCSETEGLVDKSTPLFDIVQLENSTDSYNQRWTCKKCGSAFFYGWSDFSIHVSRSYLKLENLKVADIGAEAQLPLPLFVGIFGHTLPDKTHMIPVDFDTFSTYIRELKK